MSSTLDLDRYFARIGYTGSPSATLDVLRDLQRLHPLSIPFENLDPLTGRRVDLDLAAVFDKLIERRRGGYCFEQNKLFAHVLMQLGFDVTPMIARVLWGREPDAITPRTHMLLRVSVDDQPWIADVGFGAVTLTSPLRLQTGVAQQTTHELFRLVDAPDGAFSKCYPARHGSKPIASICNARSGSITKCRTGLRRRTPRRSSRRVWWAAA